MTPTLSTGQPSTLRSYLELSTAVFGADSAAVVFLQEKADRSPNGLDEVVVADERQMVYLLGRMHLQGLEGADVGDVRPKGGA